MNGSAASAQAQEYELTKLNECLGREADLLVKFQVLQTLSALLLYITSTCVRIEGTRTCLGCPLDPPQSPAAYKN